MAEIKLEDLYRRYCEQGDLGALAVVFDRVAPDLERLALRLVTDRSKAEDLVQETFLTAIERSGNYDSGRILVPWLVGILVNHSRSARRSEGRTLDGERLVERAPGQPESEAVTAESCEAVQAAVSELPSGLRAVVEARLAGEDSAQTASQLGISQGTLRGRLHRALQAMRASLPPSLATVFAVVFLHSSALGRVRACVLSEAQSFIPKTGAGSGLGTLGVGGLWLTKKVVVASAIVALVIVGVILSNSPSEPPAPGSRPKQELAFERLEGEPLKSKGPVGPIKEVAEPNAQATTTAEGARSTVSASRPNNEWGVRVVSSIDGSAVGSPTIEPFGIPLFRQAFTGDGSGVVSLQLPPKGRFERVLVLITAKGFCRRMLWLELSESELTVGVVPSSKLQVRIEDQAGVGIEGVEIELVPPDVDGIAFKGHSSFWWLMSWGFSPDWQRVGGTSRRDPSGYRGVPLSPLEGPSLFIAADDDRFYSEILRDCLEEEAWTAKTDATGVATWEGLPPLNGYRWQAHRMRSIEFEPKRDPVVSARQPDGSLVISTSTQAPTASGAFELKAARDIVLTGVVPTACAVRGQFSSAKPVPGTFVNVHIFHRASAETVSAQGYDSSVEGPLVQCEADGSFELRDVLPGRKILRAWWKEEGNRFHFADVHFDLGRGEHKDCGELEARTGRDIEVLVDLVDELGESLDPRSALAPDSATLVSLMVNISEAAAEPFHGIMQFLEVELGERITIVGAPSGRRMMAASGSLKHVTNLKSGALIFPRYVEFKEGELDDVQLKVLLEARVEQAVEATFPEGIVAARGEAHFFGGPRSLEFGEDLRVPRSEEGVLRGSLSLTPGQYDLYVHTSASEEPDSDASYYFRGNVTVGSPSPKPIEVALQLGASVRATAHDKGGHSRTHEYLFIRPRDFGDEGKSTWTHFAKPGADGSFLVRGLIPGACYETSKGATFMAGAAGETTGVDLTW